MSYKNGPVACKALGIHYLIITCDITTGCRVVDLKCVVDYGKGEIVMIRITLGAYSSVQVPFSGMYAKVEELMRMLVFVRR